LELQDFLIQYESEKKMKYLEISGFIFCVGRISIGVEKLLKDGEPGKCLFRGFFNDEGKFFSHSAITSYMLTIERYF